MIEAMTSIGLNMEDFPECNDLPGRKRRICRGEVLTPELQDAYRRVWGIHPRFSNANPALPDQQAKSNKPITKKGCGKTLPSLAKRAWNYGSAIMRWTAAGSPVRTQEQIDTLLAICKECPLFNAEISHCSVCGCPLGSGKDALKNKLAMATEDCPHPDGSKWKATA